MRQLVFLITILLLALSGTAQENHPVLWKFSTEKVSALTYKIKFEATVREPYHIYPQGAFDAGLGMPTQFLFVQTPDVDFIGEMEERGVDQKSGVALAYYSKGAIFTQTVKLKSDQKTSLSFTIKYMACTNEMCLPPSSKKFTLVLNDPDKGSLVNSIDSTATNVTSLAKYEPFSMPDTLGTIITSSDIISKSKYTFIDFWASWCAPCRAQGRALIPVYNKYHKAGFNVLAVSLDTNPLAWTKAIRADGYSWTNVCDLKGFESPVPKKYGITAIPRNFLVDNKGVIVAMDLHGKELELLIAKLLD